MSDSPPGEQQQSAGLTWQRARSAKILSYEKPGSFVPSTRADLTKETEVIERYHATPGVVMSSCAVRLQIMTLSCCPSFSASQLSASGLSSEPAPDLETTQHWSELLQQLTVQVNTIMRAARSKSVRLKKACDQATAGYATQGPKVCYGRRSPLIPVASHHEKTVPSDQIASINIICMPAESVFLLDCLSTHKVVSDQGPGSTSGTKAPPNQSSPAPRPPAEKFARPESAAAAASASGNTQSGRGISSVWWLGGLAALGGLYAANLSMPQQQVAQTKQTADILEITPGHPALHQEEPGPLSTTPSEYAPHDAPEADQEISSVTGQPLGPHALFKDREQQDREAQARSHSTFHTDELAMPSSTAGPHPDESSNQEHEASGSHRSHEPTGQKDHIVMTDGSMLFGQAMGSYFPPDTSPGTAQQRSQQGSQDTGHTGRDGQSQTASADVHGVDRAHDSGVEAAVSVDPTPMTDLLNEALTGEMLHPEHPGHEHTTLDDPPNTHEASSSNAEDAAGSGNGAPRGEDESSEDGPESGTGSEERGDEEGRPRRQWVPPVWSRLPETGALLRGEASGPDEVNTTPASFRFQAVTQIDWKLVWTSNARARL